MALFKQPTDDTSSNIPFASDEPLFLEQDGLKQTPAETQQLSGVVGLIAERFTRSETARRPIENRWIQMWRNYRGFYAPEVAFLETERSRAFIKITKTKVLAAYGQVMDVLFASNKFPIGVQPKRTPEEALKPIVVDTNKPAEEAPVSESPYGFEGDGAEVGPGGIISKLQTAVGEGFAQAAQQFNVTQGQSAKLPGQVEVDPASIAAHRAEKKMHDQLDMASASKHLRSTCFEMVLLGAGSMKGPLSQWKDYPKWDENGAYVPERKLVPIIESPSIWNLYPDPDAKDADNLSYMIERHKMNVEQLRALKRRPFFNEEAIDRVLASGFNYTRLWWEPILQDNPSITAVERYEVLEYWGFMDRATLERQGIDIPDDYKEMDEIPVNAWKCGNELLRLVFNPLTPKRIPYFLVPYEIQPYSIWGVGLAENMSDSQDLMNGFMRMAIDNGVMSGSLVFEVDQTMLVPGQDMSLYPGKMFIKNGGQPGQSIFSHTFPNVVKSNLEMFDKARALADESTGVMSITHGQSSISPGLGRTASGISMIMGAATGNIRTVVKNIDDYLLQPLGEALYAWNKQFDPDPETTANLEIVSRGTESLMRDEVRSQRLTTFLQVGSNPALAPFIKFQYIIREIAKTLDLDPDKVTNTSEEAMLQAAIMAKMAQGAPGSTNPPSEGEDPNGNGGGNIGTGQAPGPGVGGFSASGPSSQAPQGAR